jgi:sugar phosphate isomerase/epimerase
MKTATLKTLELLRRLESRGISATFDQAHTLRRAECTLHRWAELKCGDGNGYASWAIERDETTSAPYLVTYPHTGPTRRSRVADREAGALRRVAAICAALGVTYYQQTDPRGCALYILTAGDIPAGCDVASCYTRGISCGI